MERIVKLLTTYNHNSIFLIGLYQTEKVPLEKIENINQKLKEICNNYQITFIDISEIKKQKAFFFQETSIYPNYKGHQWISEKLEIK